MTNISDKPCVRDLDPARQEIVVWSRDGKRLWSSNDCVNGTAADLRTLVPGQPVAFAVAWAGRTSTPGCAGSGPSGGRRLPGAEPGRRGDQRADRVPATAVIAVCPRWRWLPSPVMQVRFTKLAGRRYEVAVERVHGPRLEPRNGPGYDARLPHDLAHFAVEEQLGLRLGVFGQLAAGGSGLFTPAPADRSVADRRAGRRFAGAGRADMRRSEAAVGRCVAEWRRRTGLGWAGPIAEVDADLSESDVDRIVSRLDELARAWWALAPGSSLTLDWPRWATVDPAGSRQGRQQRVDRHARR